MWRTSATIVHQIHQPETGVLIGKHLTAMWYGNNRCGNKQYVENGNKYAGKYEIKMANFKSGKHDTRSEVADVDFETSYINAVESDVNMNKNCGKNDPELKDEKQHIEEGLHCNTSHPTNSYSILGDQYSCFNKNGLPHPVTHSISGHHSADQQLCAGLHCTVAYLPHQFYCYPYAMSWG